MSSPDGKPPAPSTPSAEQPVRDVVFPLGDAALRSSHAAATRLAVMGPPALTRNADSYCYGLKQFGRPMMALLVQKRLGPVRHALSQMVVAGGMATPDPVRVRVPAGMHFSAGEVISSTTPEPAPEGDKPGVIVYTPTMPPLSS